MSIGIARQAPLALLLHLIFHVRANGAEASSNLDLDLLTHHAATLRQYGELIKERIRTLKALNDVVGDLSALAQPLSEDLGVESAMRRQLSALGTSLPPMVSSEVDGRAVASSEDYLVARPRIRLRARSRLLGFVPLQAPTTSSPTALQVALPSALVFAISEFDTVALMTPSGALLSDFSAGHKRANAGTTGIVLAAASPFPAEACLLATADSGGAVRLHKVSTRVRRPPHASELRAAAATSSDGVDSQWLGVPPIRVIVDTYRVINALEGVALATRLTALVIFVPERIPSVAVGDSRGHVRFFGSSGTLRGDVTVSADSGTSVAGLIAPLQELVFWADRSWGFVDVRRSLVRSPASGPCGDGDLDDAFNMGENFGRIASIAAGSRSSTQPGVGRDEVLIVVAYECGAVVAFDVQGGGRRCVAARRLAACAIGGIAREGLAVGLGASKGLALYVGLSSDGSASGDSHVGQELSALNTVDARDSAFLWRHRLQTRAEGFAVHVGNDVWRRSGLIALLSEGGREVVMFDFILPVDSMLEDAALMAIVEKLPMLGIVFIVAVMALHSRHAAATSAAASTSATDAAETSADGKDVSPESALARSDADATPASQEPIVCAVQTVSGTFRRRAAAALRRCDAPR
eukprot:TRINITY_DN22023_c0_g1_i1.p1 TRINITY_DN22023_c0_g1~~TRINITY_DN22023_c0_g1_i1.p1  ORF type:complete len:665 (-),score=90.18 TRINITY_DN22023_c0_g1_i1:62-1975(-)